MFDDAFSTAAIAALFGLISGSAAAILERRREIAKELIEIRRDTYVQLWTKTGELPLWPRDRGYTYASLAALSASCKTWYFGTGGMYLSHDARARYGDMQKKITSVLEDRVRSAIDQPRLDEAISEKDYDDVQARCHALRAELTKDLLSRRGAGLVEWRRQWPFNRTGGSNQRDE
jgi:hypothetical protein